jgi:putative holliday junction resolvase
MKGMGIDYGTQRIGVAFSDEKGSFAFPSAVLSNEKNVTDDILLLADRENISFIVVGESKNYSGGNNKLMDEIERFVKKLKSASEMPVYMHTEVLTTKQAERIHGKSHPKTDAAAAAIILQSYLDSHAHNH